MMDLKIIIIAEQKLLCYAARNLIGYEIYKYEKDFKYIQIIIISI
jgi:hypothetical protein